MTTPIETIEDHGLSTPCRISSATPSQRYPKATIKGRLYALVPLAYTRRYGQIPQGHAVIHLCGQERCLEPRHMALIKRGRRVGLPRRDANGS